MPPDTTSRRDRLIQRTVTTTLVALALSLICVGLLLYA